MIRLFVLMLLAVVTTLPAESPTPVESAPDESSAQTGEIRRGLRMGRDRERAFFERMIRTVQPDTKGDPERLDVYVKLFERELINDTRTFATSVKAESLGERKVRLSGHVMFEENRASLRKMFTFLEFEVVDEVEVLPSADLGDPTFAFVNASSVFCYDEPTTPRETLTQAYLGEPIHLLKPAAEGYFLAATHEGYIGYIDGAALHRVSAPAFNAYQEGAQILAVRDVTAGGIFVPMGSKLKLVDDKTTVLTAVLPDGRAIELPNDSAKVVNNAVPESIGKVIAAAEARLGSDYVWGGKTSEGVDCSGLVQSSYRVVDLNLPRDTYMQAYVGTLSATRWNTGGLRRGDLLFFLNRNGRINHVAISLGGLRYIEAAGKVKYASMDPKDADYDERRAKSFAFAKRVVE